MSKEYEIDYQVNIPEWGVFSIFAKDGIDNVDEAEVFALDNLKTMYEDDAVITIETIREINNV